MDRDVGAVLLIVVLLSTQFLTIGAGTSSEVLDEYDVSNSTRFYLRDDEIVPPYKGLNETAGTGGSWGNWTIGEPGEHEFIHSWATEPMQEDISVAGTWNFTLYIEKPADTSYDPAIKANIYAYDGEDERSLHNGTSFMEIDQPGINEYSWSEEVVNPAMIFEGEMAVVKFVMDASNAPGVEYMDTEGELEMVSGEVSGFPENATEGDIYTFSEGALSEGIYNETMYLRGLPDEVTVNNLTGYHLNETQSDNMSQSDELGTGYDFHTWGIRAWVRSEDGNETEITPGHSVAVVNRSTAGSGMQNNTWNPNTTDLLPTDSMVVRLYQDRTNEMPPPPPSNLVANFTTDRLGANSLEATDWTVHYYTSRGGTDNNYMRWGDAEHDTRIEGFSWNVHEEYGLDARMEVQNISSAQHHVLEYGIASDQSEFEILLSRDGGDTYETVVQEGLSIGDYSWDLDEEEIHDGTVHLQMRSQGLNDTVQHSVDIDHIRVRAYDDITVFWNYPPEEYASHLEMPVEPSDGEYLVVSPREHQVPAGDSVTFTAVLFDQFDNRIADVSEETNWSADEQAGGVWEDSVYTTEFAGDWTITAEYMGITETVSLMVEPTDTHRVLISPDQDLVITAGDTVDFDARAVDEYGNNITTDDEDFIWLNTDETGRFYATTAGSYYVTASFDDVTSSPVSVTVEPAEAVSMELTPSESTVQAGSTQGFFTEGIDEYGNRFNITDHTEFAIDDEAKGVWFDNIYSSEIAGTWNVTGFYRALTETVTLTVQPPSVDYIRITPDTETVNAGETIRYTAEAYDEFGNFVSDVTPYTKWFIDEGAGGNWSDNEYTGELTGSWTVVGIYGDSSDNASLIVEPGSIDNIVVSPRNVTITAGTSLEYTASSHDRYGNLIEDVTPFVIWRIEEGAGGSWDNNIYSSWRQGNWTVEAVYGPYSDTTQLYVEPTDLDPDRFQLIKISGDGQNGTAGSRLGEPLVVEVRDEFGDHVGKGWRVWFNITTQGLNGDGELDRGPTVLTDEDGLAQVNLTLDTAAGYNNVTVELRGDGDEKRVAFTVSGTLPELEVDLSINVDRAVSGDVVMFRVEINNIGTERALDMWITFEMDERLTYIIDTSDTEPIQYENTYSWYFSDVDVGTHSFDIVCRVPDRIRDKQTIVSVLEAEYTNGLGEMMPTATSNEVSFEIDASLMEKIYWPYPLVPVILIAAVAAWMVLKKVEIKDAFLIHESGILLAHKTSKSKSEMDDDLFSSMLTAIQDFVRDSFQDEENYGIKRLEFGNKKILVEKGRFSYIAVVYRGRVVGPIERKMKSVLKRIEDEHKGTLRDWDGDVGDIDFEEHLETLF